MNKIIQKLATFLLTYLFFLNFNLHAQAPQKFSFQAVIRNAGGALISNSNIGIKISILQGSATGTVQFEETHAATTNTNGLVTIAIGEGTNVSGSFASINWANGPFFIKSEADPTGGTNYTITGTSQMMSVPYALFSADTKSLNQAYNSGGAGTGRTITANNGAVKIEGNDGLVITGNYNTGNDIEISGSGTRMFFNPKKSAFRAGTVNETQWNNVNLGNFSFATGVNTIASGTASFASGSNTNASGIVSMATGFDVSSPSACEVAVGLYGTTYTTNGQNTIITTDRVFSIGNGTSTSNRSNALTVLKNGNSGFGLDNPSEKIDVNGNLKISGKIINEAWQTPTLINGWVNFGSPFETSGFYKDKEGVVHLKGVIKNGVTFPAFQLPEGYRPSKQKIFTAIYNDTIGRLDVDEYGSVFPPLNAPPNSYISLEGVSFRVD